MNKQTLLASLCAGFVAAAMLSAPCAAAETAQQQAQPAAQQPMRAPIPLSLSRVEKVLGTPNVYILDCNPQDIYEKSHIKGAIHVDAEDWWKLLPKDKKNSYLIFYCINRLCNVSWEASLYAIQLGYENVFQMPDGIQGWVQNGYEFEGTGREDPGLAGRY